jgi:hypothetical protein
LAVNSHAIVIGVEQYWRPEHCLNGPLRDALAFRSWLLDKGGATERTLRLLLSPLEDRMVPEGVSFRAATWDNVMQAVEDATREAAEADRLFFYFSGHGIQDGLEPRKPVLLASDFSDAYEHTRGRVVYLDAVEDFLLLRTQIQEQYFISDACRDFRYRLSTVKIGDPNPFNLSWADLPAGRHSVLQLRISAASPGGTSRLVGDGPVRESAFTSALLAGLQAPGPAMRWSLQRGCYVVRADALLRYVDGETRRRIRNDPNRDDTAPPAFPDLSYRGRPMADGFPVLTEFPRNSVAPVPLTVELLPDEVRVADPSVAILLRDDVECDRRRLSPDAVPLEATFQLEPDDYLATAKARQFRQELDRYVWSVYGPLRRSIRLVEARGGNPGQSTSLEPPPPPQPDPTDQPTIRVEPAAEPEAEILIATGPDGIAAMELVDDSGAVMARDSGLVVLERPGPGIYRARQVMPEWPSMAQPDWPLLVRSAERQSVLVPVPPAPQSQLAVELASRLPTAVFGDRPPDAISLLCVVADLIAIEERPVLDALGVQSPVTIGGPERSWLMVLAGYDATGVTALRTTEALQVTRLDPGTGVDDPLLVLDSEIVGLAQGVLSVDSGRQLLRIGQYGTADLDVLVPTIDDHVTVVLLHRDGTGHQQLLCQLLPWRSTPSGMGRRLELMQRYLLTGDLDAAWVIVRSVSPEAPVYGEQLYGALTASGLDDEHSAMLLTEPLLDVPALRGDALVFRGLLQEARDPETAAQDYLRACEEGIPLTAAAVRSITGGCRRLGIEHVTADVAAELIPGQAKGSLWSAVWRTGIDPPDRSAFEPGLLAPNTQQDETVSQAESEEAAVPAYAFH